MGITSSASVQVLSRSGGGIRQCAAKTDIPTPMPASLRVAKLGSLAKDDVHVRQECVARPPSKALF